MSTRYALLINSLLMLVAADVVNTVLHECAHYVSALWFGLSPELHHNYVSYPDEGIPDGQRTVIAGAGPLFSLLFGALMLLIAKQLRPSLTHLFTMWLGLVGMVTCLGYLLIAPIAREGDTGKVFAYFGIPPLVSVGIAAVSFWLIYKLFNYYGRYFTLYSSSETPGPDNTLVQAIIYPTFGSIVVGTLISLPMPVWVSYLPTIFMPMSNFSLIGGFKRHPLTDQPLWISRVSVPLLVLTLGLVVLFRWLV